MGKLNLSGHLECEVGGVYHMCYFCPQEIEEIISRKGKENAPTNGQIFPYIAHYLTTGDLIYPAHEGENHISSLLEEIGRLDLLPKLFPNQLIAKPNHSGNHRTSGKGLPSDECSTTLRIKTKDDKWISKTLSRLLRFPKSENFKSYQVYRPPPQNYKGTTLVVIRSSLHGNTQVKVHGPSTALSSLIPNTATIASQPTHHHLNGHLVPSGSSAHSIVMSLEEQGFVVTVRSSRVEGRTGALITQWLLYRGSNKKLISSYGTSRRTSSLGKALGSAKKSHSLSTSRKKISKSSSTLQSRIPLPFASELSKSNFDLDKNVELSQVDRSTISNEDPKGTFNQLNSKTNDKSSTLSTSDLPSKLTPHSKTLHPSVLQKNASNVYKSQTLSEKLATKLSSKSFMEKEIPANIVYVQTMENDRETLRYKSFSTDSIAPTPIKKIKHSPSLWNLCPKSSVKKVISMLF